VNVQGVIAAANAGRRGGTRNPSWTGASEEGGEKGGAARRLYKESGLLDPLSTWQLHGDHSKVLKNGSGIREGRRYRTVTQGGALKNS